MLTIGSCQVHFKFIVKDVLVKSWSFEKGKQQWNFVEDTQSEAVFMDRWSLLPSGLYTSFMDHKKISCD